MNIKKLDTIMMIGLLFGWVPILIVCVASHQYTIGVITSILIGSSSAIFYYRLITKEQELESLT